MTHKGGGRIKKNTQDPEIALLNGAQSKKEQAEALLQASDIVLAKYSHLYFAAVGSVEFAEGHQFINARLNVLSSRRDKAGCLPVSVAVEAENLRAALAHFVAEPEGL